MFAECAQKIYLFCFSARGAAGPGGGPVGIIYLLRVPNIMTEGNLGIMACPILEDEMVYSLSRDKELGTVLLLDNPHSNSVRPKLERAGVRYELCSEDGFLNGSEKLPGKGYNVAIWMMDLGLHEEPSNLRDAIRQNAMTMQGSVDAIVLYYGLCGNALKELGTWKDDGLRIPVTILKDRDGMTCDDCISVAVGGTKNYLRLLRTYPGIMYFTPAFATNFDDLKHRMELFKGLDPEDDSRLKMIFEMADYHYVMEIPTGLGDEDAFHEATKRFAERMDFGVKYLEKEWCTLEPVERSYAEAKSLLH
jgi:hypothetical protein